MPWLQLHVTLDGSRAPLVEAACAQAGALAVTLSEAGGEAQFEPPPGTTPLWEQVRVTALFAADAESRARAGELARALAIHLAVPPRLESLEDRVWERVWMDEFAPVRFGRRLWVCPRGQLPPEAEAEAVVVELDPGLAFGTGRHPTTALCLRWLDAGPLSGATLIDYGCGSGILAIAALRLGAAQALAVDHDPQALEATAANAQHNGVADRLQICAPGRHADFQADRLVANILARPLIELAPWFATQVRPGGQLALSGLLEEQLGPVVTAYRRDFALAPPQSEDGWILLHGRRREVGDGDSD